MNPKCPICQQEMTPTANDMLFMCRLSRRGFLEEHNHHFDYEESWVYFSPDGRVLEQCCTVPPYKIMTSILEGKTVLYKARLTVNLETYDFGLSEGEVKYEKILEFNSVLDIDWSKPYLVPQRIKRLLTFS